MPQLSALALLVALDVGEVTDQRRGAFWVRLAHKAGVRLMGFARRGLLQVGNADGWR